jgi:energy-coupling factor transporter transmembrane protein EcfT
LFRTIPVTSALLTDLFQQFLALQSSTASFSISSIPLDTALLVPRIQVISALLMAFFSISPMQLDHSTPGSTLFKSLQHYSRFYLQQFLPLQSSIHGFISIPLEHSTHG